MIIKTESRIDGISCTEYAVRMDHEQNRTDTDMNSYRRSERTKQRIRKLLSVLCLTALLTSCAQHAPMPQETAMPEEPAATAAETESKGDIIILYTSDIHCGLKQGFGAVGLAQVKETLEQAGNTVLLVDDGDAIQGDAIGILTEGQAVTKVMNALGYDAAIPGNHEFDYGMEAFENVRELAEFPYLSCNITKNDALYFEPYLIKEANGKKIAFIGITTPNTMAAANPAHFKDENGNIIYGFTRDEDGSALFAQVQKYIDEVTEKGADYVVLLCHLGHDEADAPYNFQNLIEHTTGVDVLLDGHTHDEDQVIMNDKDGNQVIRSGCGTKLQAIGYVRIAGTDGSVSAGIYSWSNDILPSELFGFENRVSGAVQDVYDAMDEIMSRKIAESDVELSIYDPVKKTPNGSPERISRKQETNMADFITDALRIQTGADIAFANAGSLRDTIEQGDVTIGDILRILPFSNPVSVSKIKGSVLLDALEWGARDLPAESPILMPSGFSYEIDAAIPSPCTVDTNGQFDSVAGKRRVSNVRIHGQPIDPDREYTAAAYSYLLYEGGSGLTMFDRSMVVMEDIRLDSECVIDYVQNDLGGRIGGEYRDVYGQGRIVVNMPEED